MKLRKITSLVLSLVMVLSLFGMTVFAATGDMSNPLVFSNGLTLAFGDTSVPTWPECNMYLKETNSNTYAAVYSTNGSTVDNSFYPSILAFYALNATSITGNDIQFVTYNAVTQAPTYSNTTALNTNGYYTIVPTSNAARLVINGNITITFSAPSGVTTTAGTTPKSVVSYLPIGQFATGEGWGSCSGKFINSFASTGVSLGSLGGYIEFDFDDPTTTAIEGLTNDSRNPYGVDFVVYGNAFNGNPEAGAVQVSETGDVWYELAGSRYYDDNFNYVGTSTANKFSNAYTGTLRNADVSYKLQGPLLRTTLKDSLGNSKFSEVVFSTAKAWWPLTSEGYPMAGAPHTNEDVTVSHSNTNILFGGVTAIQDSNDTAFYAFGYADVTPNGSPANYGDAVNPYTAYTSSKVGGDGFDLEWAVDINTGEPIDVSGKTFRYVRIYSAVLDNGTFGETSTEVCGIYAAYRTAAENDAITVGRTNAPSINYGTSASSMGTNIGTASSATDNRTVNAGTYYLNVSSGADNIYINGRKVNSSEAVSFNVTAGAKTFIRVIAQDGSAQPFIKLIVFTGM